MTIQQAADLLTDEHIASCALTLSAIDCLQAEEFGLMEKNLRKLGKFSESNMVTAANAALEGYAFMCIPGNGNGIKMSLSVFLRGLQVLGRDGQVDLAMQACNVSETLTT